MDKIKCLEQSGKVLRFADYATKKKLNESIAVDVSATGIGIQFDEQTVELIWAELLGQCDGDVETLKLFISDGSGVNIEYVGERQIIEHVMDMVDARLNNEVSVRGDFQHIMNFDEFANKAKKLDYLYVMDSLVSRLYGYKNEGEQESRFTPLILDMIANNTDYGAEEEEEDAFEEVLER